MQDAGLSRMVSLIPFAPVGRSGGYDYDPFPWSGSFKTPFSVALRTVSDDAP